MIELELVIICYACASDIFTIKMYPNQMLCKSLEKYLRSLSLYCYNSFVKKIK